MTILQEIEKLKVYLTLTDWYVIRFIEKQIPVPEDIATAREAARVRISELRGE